MTMGTAEAIAHKTKGKEIISVPLGNREYLAQEEKGKKPTDFTLSDESAKRYYRVVPTRNRHAKSKTSQLFD
tara:strand:- start:172 stop:387 length:216 start_codon:yes stop_codon:yes gene_type:complete